MTVTADQTTARTTPKARILGVDLTRGIALFGMMAVHAIGIFHDDGTPTTTAVIVYGRSAALFAFMAGVSLALISGGPTLLPRWQRRVTGVGIAVRGVLIGLLGFLLAYADAAEVILPSYGVMFLLAILLIGLRARTLALIAAGFAVLGPILLVVTAGWGLPEETMWGYVTPPLGAVFTDPGGVLAVLFLSGSYPVVTYMSYVCAGMAVGRLDLSSRRVACWLLGGGITAAVFAKLVSAVLMYQLGGLDRLIPLAGPAEDGVPVRQQLLWDPPQLSSWWYLGLASPHSHTPLDLMHALGVALAVLGAALLLTRLPVVSRMLHPVAMAGTMTLTLYAAHLVVLGTDVLSDEPTTLFLLMAVTGTAFAVWWRPRFGQGPLEGIVGAAAGLARRRVAGRLRPPRTEVPDAVPAGGLLE